MPKSHTYLLELGPNSFLASAEDIWGLVEDLQLEGELSKSYDTAHNRFIFRDGICQKLPSSILEFITTKLFSFKTKLLILTEPFRTGRGDDSDSAETFFIRRFGKRIHRRRNFIFRVWNIRRQCCPFCMQKVLSYSGDLKRNMAP